MMKKLNYVFLGLGLICLIAITYLNMQLEPADVHSDGQAIIGPGLVAIMILSVLGLMVIIMLVYLVIYLIKKGFREKGTNLVMLLLLIMLIISFIVSDFDWELWL